MTTIVNEIWIAMAVLAYREKDVRYSTTNRELVKKVADLFDDSRAGISTHISQHVVAQKRLNTGYNKCFLSEDRRGFRRLFLPGDPIHESRQSNPQKLPKTEDLPEKYTYLIDWYIKNIDQGKDPYSTFNDTMKESIAPELSLETDSNDDQWLTISNFISNFHRAYINFYKSNAPYRNFKEGPCIYFHKKAINIWQDNFRIKKKSYHSILQDDDYLEAIYATLTAWGMNRLGGGPKLKSYDKFKSNLLLIADYLEQIKNFNILTIHEAKKIVKEIYLIIDPSENVRDLVAKSKTLHHLHPELFPPIDRRYTLELLTKLKGLSPRPTMNGIDFKNFWKVLSCFESLINRVGEMEVTKYIGKQIMDTSITKIMDNAIVGFSDLSPT